ncbi:hypothetical protein VOLCADRAFT_121535 [Volvox carteri f. nagariensis]|uniref:Cytochrome b561 domain-containing protein n=1 Tax=Volvox carteri f. nagariensis TaxID=3068 RepID=D8UCY0_VOLCA|nr:uncharacterized protein VOLCADRAFT_121535 [Volvox carteri f. nagariensis]EFJ42468.1 hypothetical protein VOLCADRAFT_121535 [Volvox carteri f. nagariensis]|eukprot:XP_002956531.1 hypothetical protein VOLCADRAFT_121535 [Volvox carteri f. nagariensis]
MVPKPTAMLAVCIIAFLTRSAEAYPRYWYNSLVSTADELTLPGLTQCDVHPTDAVAYLDSPHPGGSTSDSSIGFTFADAQGNLQSSTLCSGRSYTLTLSFPDRRLALLTANSSSVGFTSPKPPTNSVNLICPNRVDLGNSLSTRANLAFNATFTLLCNATGQSVLFEVTSATTQGIALWKQATVLMRVVECGTCERAPASSSPVPAPGPRPDGCAVSTLGYQCMASKSEDLGEEDEYPAAGSSSWAYDMGVTQQSSATTICFSRRLSDSRPKVSQNVKTDGTFTRMIWAISPADAFLQHLSTNRGGFAINLGLPAGVGTSAFSSVEEEEDGEEEDGEGDGDEKEGHEAGPDDGDDDKKKPPAATASGGTNCPTSNLGYSCSATVGSELAQYGTLHVAVQAAIRGYVAIGFNPTDASAMFPSDIALGWAASPKPFFSTFHATAEDLDSNDAVSPSWAYDSGVVQDSGVTTMCFSRRLNEPLAKESPDLRFIAGNSSSSGGGGGRRRLAASDGSSKLGLIWAISNSQDLIQHQSSNVGGFYLDVESGASEEAGNDDEYWINVHGALMAVAWGLLLPLGTLLPAHRWLLGNTKVFGKHLWFWLHLVCQWTGVALFIAGFVVAFVKFEEVEGDLTEAHEKIGIAVMAAAGAQVVLAYIRPDPDHPRRGLWNLIHHNLGRATILLAWANVYIGIVIYHTDFGEVYAPWIAPISIVMGVLLLATVVLRFVGPSGAGGREQNSGSEKEFKAIVATESTAADGDNGKKGASSDAGGFDQAA